MATIADALMYYRIAAKAEGKRPKTVERVTRAVRYFSDFLGEKQDITSKKGL